MRYLSPMKTPLKIAILSASVRHGRNSHRVALYFQDYIRRNRLGEVEMLDLKEYAFPLFEERLQYLENPPPEVLTFSRKISEADGILIVPSPFMSWATMFSPAPESLSIRCSVK